MSLRAIRDSFHSQFLNCRNVNNLIHSDDFELAYQRATSKARNEIKKAIDRQDKVVIKNFISEQLANITPFHELTLRNLRIIGQNIGIKEYWKKDKLTLLEEIENVVQRLKSNGQRVSVQS